jgi:hypothetical protein
MMKRNWGLWTAGAAAVGVLLFAGVAAADEADVSTERSGSIVVFPKIVWDGTRDTIIQISNTGNPMVHVHCFYINAAPADPFAPPSAFNPPQWNETDFTLWLTRQQPTHWVASLGRRTYFFDRFGSDGSGLDPGLVPPVPLGFRGELKCVQVDESGAPTPGNKLKGEATLRRFDGDVSRYNALTFQGNPALSGSQIGNDLELTRTTNNPGEYSACPDKLLLDHYADGFSDPVVEQLGTCNPVCFGGPNNSLSCSSDSDCVPSAGGRCLACPISTTLTLVPCQEDLENQQPGRVTVQFLIFNEFEQPLSASTLVDCWLDLTLTQISAAFTYAGFIGTPTAYTRISPVPGQGGVIGIAEESRRNTGFGPANNGIGVSAVAAFNLNVEGNRFDAATSTSNTYTPIAGVTDRITVPLAD